MAEAAKDFLFGKGVITTFEYEKHPQIPENWKVIKHETNKGIFDQEKISLVFPKDDLQFLKAFVNTIWEKVRVNSNIIDPILQKIDEFPEFLEELKTHKGIYVPGTHFLNSQGQECIKMFHFDEVTKDFDWTPAPLTLFAGKIPALVLKI